MVSLSKAELLRQLEELEEEEADVDASQGIEKKKASAKGRVIRVVQETKRRKNPTQQVRSPAQIAATERMRAARAAKLEEKRKELEPADGEILLKIEPPKPPRKPRKKKVVEPPPEVGHGRARGSLQQEIVEEELTELAPPPPAKRSVNAPPKRKKRPQVIIEESESESEEEDYHETQPIPIPPPQYYQPDSAYGGSPISYGNRPAPSFRNDKRFM
jgi:hypothetical protein